MGSRDTELKPPRVLAALLCLLLVLIPGSSAHAQEVDFGVEPAEGSSLANVGGYFLLKADPGDRVEQSIVVSNSSSKPLNLQLAAVDAITGPFGGASYRLPNEKSRANGAWISLENEEVRLGPREVRTVSFLVEVPSDATSGEHLAGLSVWPDEGEKAGDDQEGAVGVNVRSRRVIAVQVNTPGPSNPELEIGGVEPSARPDGIYLEIGIENTGFGLTKGKGFIELPDDGFRREFDVDTFVPQTAIGLPVKWAEDPGAGEYRAEVEIEYGDGQIANWEGTFVVGDPVLEDLENRGGATTGGIPWWWWIVPGALVLGILVLWLRRRRSSSARSAASTPPAAVEPPAVRPQTAFPTVEAPSASDGPPGRRIPPPPPPPRPTSSETPRPGPPHQTQ